MRHMTITLMYERYTGVLIDLDEETGYFHGEVADLSDVITFKGRNQSELQEALETSVREYLAFCHEIGRESTNS